jgi:galactose-1-phosphate uridylyltransferase
MMSLPNPSAHKLNDDQVASVIHKAAQLVAEDARTDMIAYMYHLAYEYNEKGNSSLFASKVEEFLKKMAA